MTKNLEVSVLLDFYGSMLTDKQRDVVELYYNEDLSLAEIAAHSGITRQGVRDSIKRAEAQLIEYEERLQLAARFRKIQDCLEEIIKHAEEIHEFDQRFGAHSQIDE
ncbi:MAG: putative DNA-binding protein, partial [Angelakisella sp.]